tara:strand:- start:123360 stop:124514 length:1155 start_codon:yes stop_codon:yes gene_type:complete
MKGLFLFSIFVITYGSLFPFEFQYVDWQEEGLSALLSTSVFDSKTPDMLGNIILFLPFGFAGTELISRAKLNKEYYFYLYGFGIALAILLQVLQIYLDYRVPALYDAVWNSVGIFVGGMLARFMHRKYPHMLEAEDKLALLALSLSWIIYLLAPFLFYFNTEILAENIRVHLDINEHRSVNIIFYMAIWIIFTKLIDELKPLGRNPLLSLEFLVLFTLTAKIFVYRDFIEPELLSGGILAIIIMRTGLFKRISPYKFCATILVPAMFYNSLYPLEFWDNSFKEFNWVPFKELFAEDMLPTIRTVFYKTFTYGAIVWSLYKSFPNSSWINYFCISYAALIEYLQHLTPLRVGGLTEPLLVLFLITFIHQKNEMFNLYNDEDSISR